MCRQLLPVGLAVAVLGSAGPAAAEQFRYKFKAGQRRETRVSVAGASLMDQGDEQVKMHFRAVVRQVARVRSVAGGVATLDTVVAPISGRMTVGDETLPVPGGGTTRSTTRVSDRGRQLGRSGAPTGGTGSPLDVVDSMYGIIFPARDLKPGDTWTETITADGERLTATFKYEAKETVFGRACARITTQFTLPSSASPSLGGPEGLPGSSNRGTVRLTTYFDPVAGEDVYSSGVVTLMSRVDLTSLNPDAGTFSTVMRINYVQSLAGLKPTSK